MENNPYLKTSSRLDNYKKKLEQRGNSQDWIFGNVFGKPGGGAPLRDKSGQIISKRKTIADGNIDRLSPEDFSKGDNNIIMYNHQLNYLNNNNINNNYNNFNNNNFNNNNFNNNNNMPFQFQNNFNNQNMNINNQIDINNNFNKTSPYFTNDIELIQNQNNFQNENNKTDYNWYINQYKTNPYMMQPFPFIFPFPIINQNQYPNIFNQNNINNNNLLTNNELQMKNNILPNGENILNNNINMINNKIEKINNPQINQYENNSYNFTNNPDERKIKEQKELEKEQWKKDLLQQIEEKKRREEEEKKKKEKLDKEEEIKYQEYLKLKRKQHDQQELKKRKNLSKKMQMAFGESDLNNIEEENNSQYDSFTNSYSNLNEKNSINENNYNNENKNQQQIEFNYVLPKEELKQQQELKNLVDIHFKDLNEDLNKDIDEQFKKISNEFNTDSKYIPYNEKLLFNYDDINYDGYSEEEKKKLENIQDLLEKKHMIDYILGKSNKPSDYQISSEDLKVPINSYFGINRENPQSINKNISLNTTSNFLVNNGYSNKFPLESHDTFIELNDNKNNINNINNYYQNKNDENNIKENINLELSQSRNDNNNNVINNSVSISQSLENKSSFVPIYNNENINKNNEEFEINSNKINNDNNDENYNLDLYKKLEEIGQLSKNINPNTKYPIKNSLNIGPYKNKYENLDYDNMIFDLKNNNNSLINSKEIINTNKKIHHNINNTSDYKSGDELSSKENDVMGTADQDKKLVNGNIETNSKNHSDNDNK